MKSIIRNLTAATAALVTLFAAAPESQATKVTLDGAGYYDRFLEKFPSLRKIGIAFACQEMEHLPLDPTDVRMDHIITEDGIVYP